MQHPTMNGAMTKGKSEACSYGGRILVLLAVVLLAITPWTEYFWHFDNFLQGGQDLELGLLSIVTIFSLVLVLVHQGKHRLRSLVATGQFSSSFFENDDALVSGSLCAPKLAFDSRPLAVLAEYNPPIQI
jgi:hypothetical protein